MKTLKQLANDAIQMQDACNGLAIANGFGRAMTDLREALNEAGEPTDTDVFRSHPVYRMWASKIHDLAGLGLSDCDRYGDAYKWCSEQAEK
jgi:hypothetical protein